MCGVVLISLYLAKGPKIRSYIDYTECDRLSICLRKMEIGLRGNLGDVRMLTA